jgi:hypothetical protein
MHFLNDTEPIFLQTDSSDYGIGGYLFQVVGRVVNEEPTKPTVRITEIDHESFQAESGNIYFTILLETIHDLFL